MVLGLEPMAAFLFFQVAPYCALHQGDCGGTTEDERGNLILPLSASIIPAMCLHLSSANSFLSVVVESIFKFSQRLQNRPHCTLSAIPEQATCLANSSTSPSSEARDVSPDLAASSV